MPLRRHRLETRRVDRQSAHDTEGRIGSPILSSPREEMDVTQQATDVTTHYSSTPVALVSSYTLVQMRSRLPSASPIARTKPQSASGVNSPV